MLILINNSNYDEDGSPGLKWANAFDIPFDPGEQESKMPASFF
jgi:hypothetical protein